MAKEQLTAFNADFSFYKQLDYFYRANKSKIWHCFSYATRRFLDYNDPCKNPFAFLRQPQYEALEMYVFVKEFLCNAHMCEIFNNWSKRQDKFSDFSYYTIHKGGQSSLIDLGDEQNEIIFNQMKKYMEDYPNYIYALTMGLGKTILMATCIFYEFLLAYKNPSSKLFCHNALVFAPDKTVLESLREIKTFDKTKVIPPEYMSLFDSSKICLRFYFLTENDELLTYDGSDFNIVITNTQKIIVKKKHKKDSAVTMLLTGIDDETHDENYLMGNQRFQKLCRLPQLGVYVDEAHHLFGANLEKELRVGTGNKTTLRNTINLLAAKTSIVACYNFTGTPYVNNQVLPEVVYAYGLQESIVNGYLKDVLPISFENVKDEVFLRATISEFLARYKGKTYEGLRPKLAIFAATVDEAVNVVRPAVETILSEFDVAISSILVNTGDPSITKNDDIRNFNSLDVKDSEGDKKQFIILVEKGREGWNCRSLLGVALFRSPKSKIFVLQATMRCLRKLTNKQIQATVFLSKENYETLDKELKKNYNVAISDLNNRSNNKNKKVYRVRVVPPIPKITLKRTFHSYFLVEKDFPTHLDFGLATLDEKPFEGKMTERGSLRFSSAKKETNIDVHKKQAVFSKFSLVAEISRCMNIPCLKIERLFREATDNIDSVVDAVNRHNEILYEKVIPEIFHALYKVDCQTHTKEEKIALIKEPKDPDYYEFTASNDLVITKNDNGLNSYDIEKSFHVDTYCFDSIPEKDFFLQQIKRKKIKEIYFTGMFTSHQGEFFVHYIDPESHQLRIYYPDFLVRLEDDSYVIIEVKGDNMIDDTVVKAKAAAAEELAVTSGMRYVMCPSSAATDPNVLDSDKSVQKNLNLGDNLK